MVVRKRRCPRTGSILVWVGTAISVAIVALWAASTHWIVGDVGEHYQVSVFDGCIACTVLIGSPRDVEDTRDYYIGLPPGGYCLVREDLSDAPVGWSRWGFVLPWGNAKRGEPSVPAVAVAGGILPLWLPLAVIVVFVAVLSWRQRSRGLRGGCIVCSYDLTGNVSGICPECGTPIPKAVKQDSRAKADEIAP